MDDAERLLIGCCCRQTPEPDTRARARSGLMQSGKRATPYDPVLMDEPAVFPVAELDSPQFFDAEQHPFTQEQPEPPAAPVPDWPHATVYSAADNGLRVLLDNATFSAGFPYTQLGVEEWTEFDHQKRLALVPSNQWSEKVSTPISSDLPPALEALISDKRSLSEWLTDMNALQSSLQPDGRGFVNINGGILGPSLVEWQEITDGYQIDYATGEIGESKRRGPTVDVAYWYPAEYYFAVPYKETPDSEYWKMKVSKAETFQLYAQARPDGQKPPEQWEIINVWMMVRGGTAEDTARWLIAGGIGQSRNIGLPGDMAGFNLHLVPGEYVWTWVSDPVPASLRVSRPSGQSSLPLQPLTERMNFASPTFAGGKWEVFGGAENWVGPYEDWVGNQSDGGETLAKSAPAGKIIINGQTEQGWAAWTAVINPPLQVPAGGAPALPDAHLILFRADLVRVYRSLTTPVDMPWVDFARDILRMEGAEFRAAGGVTAHHTPIRERAWVGVNWQGQDYNVALAAFHPWRDGTPEEWREAKASRPRNKAGWERHVAAGRPYPVRPIGLTQAGIRSGSFGVIKYGEYNTYTRSTRLQAGGMAAVVPRGTAIHQPQELKRVDGKLYLNLTKETRFLLLDGKGDHRQLTIGGKTPRRTDWLGLPVMPKERPTVTRNLRPLAVTFYPPLPAGVHEIKGLSIKAAYRSEGGAP